MEKKDIIAFFDRCAPLWDSEQLPKDAIIGKILDNIGMGPGVAVLDVACGTGVMMPHYLKRGAGCVLGVDISPEMIKLAKAKFNDDRISFLCADMEDVDLPAEFDCAVVYNAFPHFPNPEALIEKLASCIKPGGRLTVAHSAGREEIDSHHKGHAARVSNGLMPAEDLADIFGRYLEVTAIISTGEMYQVVGIKK